MHYSRYTKFKENILVDKTVINCRGWLKMFPRKSLVCLIIAVTCWRDGRQRSKTWHQGTYIILGELFFPNSRFSCTVDDDVGGDWYRPDELFNSIVLNFHFYFLRNKYFITANKSFKRWIKFTLWMILIYTYIQIQFAMLNPIPPWLFLEPVTPWGGSIWPLLLISKLKKLLTWNFNQS